MAYLLSCPHCDARTIDAADKLECGMFGPACRCSACGGYSRELRGPRLRISILLYLLPYGVFLLLLGLLHVLPRRGDEAMLYAMIVLGACLLLWQHWLAYVVEARLTRDIPLQAVSSNRWWRYWAVLKQVCAWSFLALVLGVLLFVWQVNHQ